MSSDNDGFICGTGLDDPEHASFTDVFATREEAITYGREDVGWTDGKTFQTGFLRHFMAEMPNQLCGEHACDQAENDEWGEGAMEQWQDKVFAKDSGILDDLQERLDKVWEEWTAAHKLTIELMSIDDIETHEFEEKAEPSKETV